MFSNLRFANIHFERILWIIRRFKILSLRNENEKRLKTV